MTAKELWKKYNEMKHPEEIFEIHEMFESLSQNEKEEFRKISNRDQVAMHYSTAVEMKRKGSWDDYVREWEKNRGKTGEERLIEYMRERGISFPGKV